MTAKLGFCVEFRWAFLTLIPNSAEISVDSNHVLVEIGTPAVLSSTLFADVSLSRFTGGGLLLSFVNCGDVSSQVGGGEEATVAVGTGFREDLLVDAFGVGGELGGIKRQAAEVAEHFGRRVAVSEVRGEVTENDINFV